MSSIADTEARVTTPGPPVIHPLYVRITHWINAVAILIMIASGWQIYNASPLFGFTLFVCPTGWVFLFVPT